MSHQEPQELGVVLVTVAHAVLIALPLVFLHHLEKTQQMVSFTGVKEGGESMQTYSRHKSVLDKSAELGLLNTCLNHLL